MGAGFEGIRTDQGESEKRFAVQGGGSLRVEDCRWELRKMKNATEKAGFLLIIVQEMGRLKLQVGAVDGRRPCGQVS